MFLCIDRLYTWDGMSDDFLLWVVTMQWVGLYLLWKI